MDNVRIHTGRETQEKLDVSRFKRTPQHTPDIALSDFFLFGWLNPSLTGENVMGEMNYMQ
jgi:hypothetical protein